MDRGQTEDGHRLSFTAELQFKWRFWVHEVLSEKDFSNSHPVQGTGQAISNLKTNQTSLGSA